MPLSDAGANNVLDEIFNAGAGSFPAGDAYLQLHSGDPGAGGTTNIIDIPRVQFACPSAASRTLENSAIIDFTTMPAVAAPGVVAWSVWDVADATPLTPGGVCYWTGWLSLSSGTAQVDAGSDVTNNDIESTAHGLVLDDRVMFEALEGLTIPAGLTAGTLYFVISTGITTDSFRVSATSGGAAIDITAAGQALWRKVSGKPVTAGDTFRINAGALDFFA